MRQLIWALTFSFLYDAAFAAEAKTQKPIWEWTIEERLAARLDQRRMQSQSAEARPDSTSSLITGAETPELLLPSELFGRLLRVAFNPNPDGREIIRGDFEARARQAGLALPEEFWATLETASADYIRTFSEQEELAKAREKASVREDFDLGQKFIKLQQSQCRLRAWSLGKARSALGSQILDRFLYTAVAPTTFVTVLKQESAEDLRFREGGCQ